jgi:hypothetical protein
VYLHVGVSDCFDIRPLGMLPWIMTFSIPTAWKRRLDESSNGKKD